MQVSCIAVVDRAVLRRRRAASVLAWLAFGMGAAVGCASSAPSADATGSGGATQVDSASGVGGAATSPGGRGSASVVGASGAGETGASAGASGRSSGASAGRGGESASGTGGMGSGSGGQGSGGATGSGGAAGAGSGGSGGSQAGQKFVGNITTKNDVRSDFVTYWNQITPENEGKWGSVEGMHNQMSWAGLDRVHDYAKQHGLPFKQHNFVWGSQQPSWLNGMAAAQQKAEVEEWIRLFCERYPDVDLIDVVNEPPPHTTPVYAEALGGAGSSGYDWIVQAFKWARQYCPSAILILNDYNNIEYSADNSHLIDIVNAIKAAGAPIDAIGAQAHDAYKLPTSTVQGLLDKLASSTGLPVYVSEYDIDLADDNQQQQVMQSQLTMFWNDDNVKGITLWGYIVGSTWRTNTGLVTTSGTKRPAMTWLMSFLGR
jgi:endo-1,4-beta-xylanase